MAPSPTETFELPVYSDKETPVLSIPPMELITDEAVINNFFIRRLNPNYHPDFSVPKAIFYFSSGGHMSHLDIVTKKCKTLAVYGGREDKAKDEVDIFTRENWAMNKDYETWFHFGDRAIITWILYERTVNLDLLTPYDMVFKLNNDEALHAFLAANPEGQELAFSLTKENGAVSLLLAQLNEHQFYLTRSSSIWATNHSDLYEVKTDRNVSEYSLKEPYIAVFSSSQPTFNKFSKREYLEY